MANRDPKAPLPKVLRPFSDEETSWWWQGSSVFTCHGFWVIFVFGAICGFTAYKTYQNLDQGGFIAKKIDIVAAMQRQTGIMQQQLVEQQKANAILGDISRNTAVTKREVSDDPRKELVNLGFNWSNNDYERALRQADEKAVALYVQAGFVPTDRTEFMPYWAFKSKNSTIVGLVAKTQPAVQPSSCGRVVWGMDKETPRNADTKAFLTKACGSPEALKLFRERMESLEKRRAASFAAEKSYEGFDGAYGSEYVPMKLALQILD